MAINYQFIAQTTLASTVTTVTFSNIPQNFTDLYLVVNSYTTSLSGTQPFYLIFNSDTSSTNYVGGYTLQSGTTKYATTIAGATVSSSQVSGYSASTANGYPVYTSVYIGNYSGASLGYQTLWNSVTDASTTINQIAWGMMNYTSTASALTTLAVHSATTTSFAAGSTFSLYGILKAGV